MDVQWVRDLLRQCQQPGVSTVPFVKQLGAVAGRELGARSKGGDWDQWPEDQTPPARLSSWARTRSGPLSKAPATARPTISSADIQQQ
jgi:hypothetical protein